MDKKPPGGGEKKKKKESVKVVFVLAVVLFRFCSFQKNRFDTTSWDCVVETFGRRKKHQGRGGEGKKEEKGEKRGRRGHDHSPRALALSWRQNPSRRERDVLQTSLPQRFGKQKTIPTAL